MALGIVPNGIKVEWNMVQNGIPVVNRVFTTLGGSPVLGDLQDAITAAKDFYDDFKGFQDPSCVLQSIIATDVSVANGIQEIVPYATTNVGTGSGGPAAANAAMCASLRTAFTGRSFRGRFYVGGLAQDVINDAQNFGTASVALLSTYFVDFITALQAIGQTLVVVSNYAANIERIIALATEIIAIITDTKIDSQRRRTAN